MTEEPKKRRFLTTQQVAEELNVSSNQIRALLKTGQLRAIQVGGRVTGPQWHPSCRDPRDPECGSGKRSGRGSL
ncbi:helix-turn-helix domain-containing protein [Pseudarthrobacter siccitolerans]|uniref:helix-turn-helix domain-containing protein n=1 Tax=Pseudarthrobacter siccitolerans TaxID=861266 RepID=UPI0009F960E7